MDKNKNRSLKIYKDSILELITSALRLEGLSTLRGITLTILEGEYKGVSKEEVNIVRNTREAYKCLEDLIYDYPMDFPLICHYHSLLSTNLVREPGSVRTFPVTISGTKYVPHIPDVPTIKDKIAEFTREQTKENIIKLMLYLMRTQMFEDCNKRTSVVVANHLLIENDLGVLMMPQSKNELNVFITKLIKYYETEEYGDIVEHIIDNYIVSPSSLDDDMNSLNFN